MGTEHANDKAKDEKLVQKVLEEAALKADNDTFERNQRACNGIVFGIEESPSTDSSQRIIEDTRIVTTKLGVDEEDIRSVYRVGRRLEGKRNARPMVIRFMNVRAADYWHNGGLGRNTGTKYDGKFVYINKDLCHADREAFKRARISKNSRDSDQKLS